MPSTQSPSPFTTTHSQPPAITPDPDQLQPVSTQSAAWMTYIPHAQQALYLGTSFTDLGFKIAKSSTQFGFSLSRKVIDTALNTITSPLQATDSNQSQTLSSAINAGVSLAEWITMQGINLGEQISKTSLGLASTTVSRLDGFYRSHLRDEYTNLKALKLFVKMVRKEWKDEPEYDPPGGISSFGILDVLKAISCWALLQNLTSVIYSQRILIDLKEIQLDGSSESLKVISTLDPMDQVSEPNLRLPSDQSYEFVTDTKVEALPFDLHSVPGEIITGEVIRSSKTHHPHCSTHKSQSHDPDQNTLKKFKTYSGLCTHSYGGLGYLMFGGVPTGGPPPSDIPSSNDESPSAVRDHPPKAKEPVLQRSEELPALQVDKSDLPPIPGSLAIPLEPCSDELRMNSKKPMEETEPQVSYRTWSLLTGKQ